MIARLLLALLLAAFASPVGASAGCHDAPAAAAHHAMPGMPDHRAVPVHACIGCVPPSDWRRHAPAPLMVSREPQPTPRFARPLVGEAQPPALPPPRIG